MHAYPSPAPVLNCLTRNSYHKDRSTRVQLAAGKLLSKRGKRQMSLSWLMLLLFIHEGCVLDLIKKE